MALGVSGTVRRFAVPAFEPNAKNDVTTTGWGVSVDVLFPIIAASTGAHNNALTFTGSFVRGEGIADLYTGLGGPPFPSLPNPGKVTPAPTTPRARSRAGRVRRPGILHALSIVLLVGLQYWLPNDRCRRRDHSSAVVQRRGAGQWRKERGGAAAYASGAVFWDVAQPIRLGLEFAWLQQDFTEGSPSVDRRVQLSGWYVF